MIVPAGTRRPVIVTDANVIIDFLFGDSPKLEELIRTGNTFHAPHLLDIEVAHALRRFTLRETITSKRAQTALEHLAATPIERYPHQPFLPRIWQLRHNLTAYDAAYLALSEALNATLITGDAALADIAAGRVQVIRPDQPTG